MKKVTIDEVGFGFKGDRLKITKFNSTQNDRSPQLILEQWKQLYSDFKTGKTNLLHIDDLKQSPTPLIQTPKPNPKSPDPVEKLKPALVKMDQKLLDKSSESFPIEIPQNIPNTSDQDLNSDLNLVDSMYLENYNEDPKYLDKSDCIPDDKLTQIESSSSIPGLDFEAEQIFEAKKNIHAQISRDTSKDINTPILANRLISNITPKNIPRNPFRHLNSDSPLQISRLSKTKNMPQSENSYQNETSPNISYANLYPSQLNNRKNAQTTPSKSIQTSSTQLLFTSPQANTPSSARNGRDSLLLRFSSSPKILDLGLSNYPTNLPPSEEQDSLVFASNRIVVDSNINTAGNLSSKDQNASYQNHTKTKDTEFKNADKYSLESNIDLRTFSNDEFDDEDFQDIQFDDPRNINQIQNITNPGLKSNIDYDQSKVIQNADELHINNNRYRFNKSSLMGANPNFALARGNLGTKSQEFLSLSFEDIDFDDLNQIPSKNTILSSNNISNNSANQGHDTFSKKESFLSMFEQDHTLGIDEETKRKILDEDSLFESILKKAKTTKPVEFKTPFKKPRNKTENSSVNTGSLSVIKPSLNPNPLSLNGDKDFENMLSSVLKNSKNNPQKKFKTPSKKKNAPGFNSLIDGVKTNQTSSSFKSPLQTLVNKDQRNSHSNAAESHNSAGLDKQTQMDDMSELEAQNIIKNLGGISFASSISKGIADTQKTLGLNSNVTPEVKTTSRIYNHINSEHLRNKTVSLSNSKLSMPNDEPTISNKLVPGNHNKASLISYHQNTSSHLNKNTSLNQENKPICTPSITSQIFTKPISSTNQRSLHSSSNTRSAVGNYGFSTPTKNPSLFSKEGISSSCSSQNPAASSNKIGILDNKYISSGTSSVNKELFSDIKPSSANLYNITPISSSKSKSSFRSMHKLGLSNPKSGNNKSRPLFKTPISINKFNVQFKSPTPKSNLALSPEIFNQGDSNTLQNYTNKKEDIPVVDQKLSLCNFSIAYKSLPLLSTRFDVNKFNISFSQARNFVFDEINSSVSEGWGFDKAFEKLKESIDMRYTSMSEDEFKVWAEFQYQNIIWYLSSLARRFPGTGILIFNPDAVSKRLSKKYEMEFIRAQRPSIRKILEKDASSKSLMVLCIADTISEDTILLTDGWYVIQAKMNSVLSLAIARGRLKVGTKIVLAGAQLIPGPNGQDGISPWQIPDLKAETAPTLLITSNSTRTCKWDQKIGFVGKKNRMSLSLHTLNADGGPAYGELDLIICRRYPLRYIETLPNGKRVSRSSSQESRASSAYLELKRQHANKLLSEIQKENNSRKKVPLKSILLTNLDEKSGEELFELFSTCSDQQEFYSILSAEQRESLNKQISEKQFETESSINDELPDVILPRKVSSYFQVLVDDFRVSKKMKPEKKYKRVVLSIWNSDHSVWNSFSEGARIKIYGAVPSGYKHDHQVAEIKKRDSSRNFLRLNLTRGSKWIPVTLLKPLGQYHDNYVPRSSYLVSQISRNQLYTDIDIFAKVLDCSKANHFGQEVTCLTISDPDFLSISKYKKSVNFNDQSLLFANPNKSLASDSKAIDEPNQNQGHHSPSFTKISTLDELSGLYGGGSAKPGLEIYKDISTAVVENKSSLGTTIKVYFSLQVFGPISLKVDSVVYIKDIYLNYLDMRSGLFTAISRDYTDISTIYSPSFAKK
ncbi:hypothetical protein BB560_003849 [Smittium megazygosporum]|uniref:Tower domain-containing protein n=1 Tax=Smittium megazygosporum TaxID=133381 RepID=A0A2T9ZAW7_9FUNG|nr:hypothetical protein BB560_003849 [Smittium megazygosporum]